MTRAGALRNRETAYDGTNNDREDQGVGRDGHMRHE